MALLVGVRGICSAYIQEAEKMGWGFLSAGKGNGEEDDLMVGTKYGEEIIGALVLRLESGTPTSPSQKKKSKANPTGKGSKGVIRAWAVRLRYRHKGIGTGLLEEAIRITREKLGREAEIGFAADHANSKMVLPGIFNGVFKKGQRKAVECLEEVKKAEMDSGGGKGKKR